MNKGPILLVDNSNTRTKFTLLHEGELGRQVACLPTAMLTVAAIRDLLAEQGWTCCSTLICSVVPDAARIIAEAVGGEVKMLSATSPMPMVIDYLGAATLGADRIANALAVSARFPLPCVVADFGTAVTFDVVVPGEERPRFIGGVIAPGLGAMGQYLNRNTALLPALEPERPGHAIGRSTEEALHAGAFHGYCGLVRGILSAIAAELGQAPCVVATGGDAALLADWLPEIDSVQAGLTFEGMALAAESQC